jgi:hypothetical protein
MTRDFMRVIGDEAALIGRLGAAQPDTSELFTFRRLAPLAWLQRDSLSTANPRASGSVP